VRESTKQFLRGCNDTIRRSSVQLQRNVNAMPLQHSRGDRTAIELFVGGPPQLELRASKRSLRASDDRSCGHACVPMPLGSHALAVGPLSERPLNYRPNGAGSALVSGHDAQVSAMDS
jgi:hypothetical protein